MHFFGFSGSIAAQLKLVFSISRFILSFSSSTSSLCYISSASLVHEQAGSFS
jgi:hypothetical protein